MKNQQVSVDYWAMGKAMLTYAVLTAAGWLMMRLFSTVFTLPRRMRAQQEKIQGTLEDLQRRFPDLNITQEDLDNADKELEALTKEVEEQEKERRKQIEKGPMEDETSKEENAEVIEDKKTI